MILFLIWFLGRKTIIICCNDSCSGEAFYSSCYDGLKLAGLSIITLNSFFNCRFLLILLLFITYNSPLLFPILSSTPLFYCFFTYKLKSIQDHYNTKSLWNSLGLSRLYYLDIWYTCQSPNTNQVRIKGTSIKQILTVFWLGLPTDWTNHTNPINQTHSN